MDAKTFTVQVGNKITLDAHKVQMLNSMNGTIHIVEGDHHSQHPSVEFNLADVGLHFTVKFHVDHLDIFWRSPFEGSTSHGLIGEPTNIRM